MSRGRLLHFTGWDFISCLCCTFMHLHFCLHGDEPKSNPRPQFGFSSEMSTTFASYKSKVPILDKKTAILMQRNTRNISKSFMRTFLREMKGGNRSWCGLIEGAIGIDAAIQATYKFDRTHRICLFKRH